MTRVRVSVRVEGVVQGVGFRPFVYSLAARLGLGGFVGNDSDGVFAEVEGSPEAVEAFVDQIKRDAPPLARIERVTTRPVPPRRTTTFTIVASGPRGTTRTLVSPDTATCDDCLRELSDPAGAPSGQRAVSGSLPWNRHGLADRVRANPVHGFLRCLKVRDEVTVEFALNLP